MRLLLASIASGATSLPSADFTLIFIVIILAGKEAAMWKGKIKQEIRAYFYAFICADDSYGTGLFLAFLGINASGRTAAKLRLFLLFWKIILYFTLLCEVLEVMAVCTAHHTVGSNLTRASQY